jgi:hypothetical protein
VRSPEQRRRTAFHEASHSVIANMLGLRVGVVSIRPSKNHSGVAFAGGPIKLLESEAGKIMRPAPLMPARFRRLVETRIMVSLAGDSGEAYAMTDRSGYVDQTDLREAERLAAMIASPLKPSELSKIEQRLLAAAETGPKPTSDEARSLELALVTTDDDAEARALVAYLRVVTARMVFSEPAASRIPLFAETLLAKEVLSARSTRRALRGEFTGSSPASRSGQQLSHARGPRQ